MVYSRQHIQGLEEKWLPIVDPWKSYGSLALSTFVLIDSFPDVAAGAGKSILWCAVSHLLVIEYLYF